MQAKHRDLNLKIQKMRQELLQTKPGLEENGEFVYNSKYLKMIELCIQNKELLFDM